MDIYLVGGAVRDELLGLPVKDRDWVVVGATPKEMCDRGFRQVGADFPVFLHPDTNEEYALARTERKQGHGYHGFAVYSAPDVTLEDDLQRRDLTINAMAQSDTGELVDPFHGRDDLRARRLRHVSEAFSEDPLRILRTARFAARLYPMGFRVAEDTMALMTTMVDAGEVEHLVPERVWQEIQRALCESSPMTFFEVLRDCGALDRLIPELAPEDSFEQAMGALNCTHGQNRPAQVRFAALLSPLPPKANADRADALKAPNDCRDLSRLFAGLFPAIGRLTGGHSDAQSILAILEQADVWRRPERFDALLQVAACAQPPVTPRIVALLEEAAAVCTDVEPRKLMALGHRGKALGEAIRAERLQRVTDILRP